MLEQIFLLCPKDKIHYYLKTDIEVKRAPPCSPENTVFFMTSKMPLVLGSWDSEGHQEVCFNNCLVAR